MYKAYSHRSTVVLYQKSTKNYFCARNPLLVAKEILLNICAFCDSNIEVMMHYCHAAVVLITTFSKRG